MNGQYDGCYCYYDDDVDGNLDDAQEVVSRTLLDLMESNLLMFLRLLNCLSLMR